MKPLQLTAPGEREIVMTRVFDAPRKLVFDAFAKPELLRRWLLGPPGWSMPVCEIDLRVGGAYRYVWRRDKDGTEMGMGGVYREIVAPERVVATEKFDQSWYPGEAVGTFVLVEQDERAHGLTGIPGLVKLFGGDNALRRHDFAINAAHTHFSSVFVTAPHVAVLAAH